MKKIATPLTWIIWLIVALFYFYEYVLRSAPSIMLPSLEQYFGLSSLGIGVLIGCYYYSYAPLQLVAGALLDRFGAKYTVPFAALLCALGSFLFLVQDTYIAGFGRLLMGAGSAFAFVGVIYVSTTWIRAKYHGLVIGLTQTMGMLGGIAGESALVNMYNSNNWKNAWIMLGMIAIVLMIILLLIIPKRPSKLSQASHQQGGILKNYKLVLSNRSTWLCGCIGGFVFAPTTIFAMLWGVPFFEKAYQYNAIHSAWLNSAVLLGWVFGAPLSGIIADFVGQRRIVLIISTVAVLILFSLVVYVPLPSFDLVMLMMFLLGLFSGAQILVFAIAKSLNPEYAKGSVIGGVNFLVFIWAAILTPFSSRLLSWIHKGDIQNISAQDYKYALLIVVLCLVIAAVMGFLLKKDKIA